MGKTTVKAISLKYGTTGVDATTPLMGVLKVLRPSSTTAHLTSFMMAIP